MGKRSRRGGTRRGRTETSRRCSGSPKNSCHCCRSSSTCCCRESHTRRSGRPEQKGSSKRGCYSSSCERKRRTETGRTRGGRKSTTCCRLQGKRKGGNYKK